MQAEQQQNITVQDRITKALLSGNKRFWRCSGKITNKKSRLYGAACNKILCEANSRGEIAGRIKCSHCGHMNEI